MRFIGAGAIGVSAIWTLLKLVKPVVSRIWPARWRRSRARKAGKADTLPITERDIPIGIVGLITLVCMVPIGWVLGSFANASGLGSHVTTLVIGGVFYVFLMSFFVSAVCGYMAGLIGSSNSPLSGIGILVVIGAALVARRRRSTLRRTGCDQSADGLRAFHHRGRFQCRRDRE